ncbi:MAG TPA: penicillin-binding protein 2 [Gaiellaceae bacterium]|nr:penicillin-binding protein 2 [Gaiellaceae bacterium]
MASTSAGRLRGRAVDVERDVAVEPYRVTPKLARRLAILGGLLLIGFAALVMRLWTLQVLAGSEYAARANANQRRVVPVRAERGAIVARNGNPLVTSAAVTSVDLYPSALPKVGERRHRELVDLARITHVPLGTIRRAISQRERANDMIDPVVVRPEAPSPLVTYLQERRSQFPGVSLGQTYVRRYPHGDLAAQLFGVVGQISPSELQTMAKQGLQPGDEIGQSGIEYAFNSYLQGVDGSARVRVDSFGRRRSQRALVTPAQPGQTVRLTLDTGLQRAAQSALAYGIQLAHNNHQWAADGGAIVAMDPRNGAILASASSPTYNPSIFSGRVTQRALNNAGLGSQQSALDHNYPSINRVLDATYPPGSIFKPLTAIAALQEGIVNPYALEPCTGTYVAPEDRGHHVWHNWDPNVNQAMDMPTAIAYSCDTYFYRLGNAFYLLPPDRGSPEQKWARAFGFGRQTPIEIGPQASGLLPTIKWKHETYTRKTDPCCWRIDRIWKPGDSIQLAIGQGDMTVTPLQMARFYSAIANGGKLVQPHILLDVENPNKTPFPTPAPATPRPIVGLSASALRVVQQGLYEGAHTPIGTSYGVFGHFPVPIAGKTGTAQKVVQLPGITRLENQSWWCGYGPFNAPKLVVCAVIENGGLGGTAAAPAAEQVFAKFFHVHPGQLGYIHSD